MHSIVCQGIQAKDFPGSKQARKDKTSLPLEYKVPKSFLTGPILFNRSRISCLIECGENHHHYILSSNKPTTNETLIMNSVDTNILGKHKKGKNNG